MSFVEQAAVDQVADVSILLVEDDEGDAVLVQACLFEVGLPEGAVTWARSVAEARAALEHTDPGCILVDLGLPDAAGFGAVHALTSLAPDIAVIVLTGRQERDGVDALGAGAQDYLVKDHITGESLERSIRYARERVRARRAQDLLREARLSAAEQSRLERGLLPTPMLRTDAVACATYYQPGRDDAVLGGDFFDIVETADGRLRAVIGDVMGHGPDEAALGVHLRVAWRTMLLAGVPDDEILPTMEKLLGAEDVEHPRYVTACDITLEAGLMLVRVAGHPAPVHYARAGADGDTSTYLDLAVGPPLGVRMPPAFAAGWPVNHVAMTPSSSVVLYTDGLLEAYTDDDPEELGIPQLVSAVQQRAHGGEPATSWIRALVEDAPNASVDDTAIVVLTTAP